MATLKNAGAEFFIGTSGYSYPDWKGVVYSLTLPAPVVVAIR
jgi:hypothetical protein